MPAKKSTKKPAKKSGEDESLDAKLDAFMNKILGVIDERLPKEDADETEVDPNSAKLDAGAVIFREVLKNNFPKEKLDAWGYDELLIAMEMKQDASPILNEIVEKTDAKKDNDTPAWLKAVVN